jgi:hypothetical protein
MPNSLTLLLLKKDEKKAKFSAEMEEEREFRKGFKENTEVLTRT